jgi:hypothetical protein
MDSGTLDVPSRQRRLALASATRPRPRQARAKIKQRIARGDVSAAQVILVHQREVEGMPVADVLRSQRQWGSTRCRRFLLPLQIKETKTIGSLTERQRLALAAQLIGSGIGPPRSPPSDHPAPGEGSAWPR